MKLALLTLFLLLSGCASKGSADLVWDASQETDIAWYNIYISEIPGALTHHFLVDSQVKPSMYDVKGLNYGQTYYFVVTAIDLSGLESEPSNEVQYVPIKQ